MFDAVKESERINEVITLLEEQKAGVEEKYRKLAEEETEKLTSTIDAYKDLLKIWEGVEVTEKPKRKRRTKAEMEAARLAEAAGSAEEETSEETEETEPEFDGAGFIEEDNEPEPPSTAKPEEIVDTIFPENNETTEEKSEAVDTSIDVEETVVDDGWPEFPEEWNN